MSSILDRIMRAGEGKTLRHLTKIAAEVNSFEAAISPLSDEALKAKTQEFNQRTSTDTKNTQSGMGGKQS